LEEILVKIYCEGYDIQEIPFHYASRNKGRSKARILRLGYAYIKTLYSLWKLRNSIQCADYDSRAYDSIIIPQRYWQRSRYRIIQHMLRGMQNPLVDIGCGTHRIIQNTAVMAGLDIQFNKLRFVKTRNPKLMQGDIHHLPLKTASCRGVVCSQVIEHVPYNEYLFKEFNRILKTGGILILGTPDYASRWWRMIEKIYKQVLPNAYADEHITHYTLHSLQELLKKNGFDILEKKSILSSEVLLKSRKIT
jgi:ubiquinone/menaquinone biosynthesis C-methylase UbiE